MRPGVRYTVGYQETKGWEKTLTKGNHNLGHYYWSPMVNMIQTTPSKKTSKQSVRVAPPKKSNYHYIKPKKAALPINPNATLPPRLERPNRALARHLPPPKNTRIKQVMANVSYKKPRHSRRRRAHNRNVNGKLISRNTQAALYADYAKDTNSTATSGNLTSKDVHGDLLK